MSVQKYKISKRNGNFTTVLNKVIKCLSKQTDLLGFYVYLLHLPADWIFYKTELKSTLGIGIKKIERHFAQLAQMNLIKIEQLRNEKGHFAHIDLEVLDGEDLIIIELDKNKHKNAQPWVETRTTANRTTDLGSYKRNTDKRNKNKQNKDQKLLCASKNNARSRFDEFWFVYPRKKDKIRAQKVWISKNLDHIADKLIEDVLNRTKNEAQWQTKSFIPHPDTYLRNERWNDEVDAPPVQTGRQLSAGKQAMANIFREIREGKLQ